MHPLKQEANRVAAIRRQLVAEFGEDNDAIEDTLDGLTSFREIAVWCAKQAEADKVLVDGLTEAIRNYSGRKHRLAERIVRRRQLILECMTEAGVTNIEAPEFTLVKAKGTGKIVVDDVELLDEQFIRTIVEPDKLKIREALNRGDEVEGARFDNAAPSLVIRRT